MAAEENAPVGAPTGREPAQEGPEGRRRSAGLIFGLLVVAGLLIVAALLIGRAQTERVNQGAPVARPIPAGAGAPHGAMHTPGP